ncbi:MAG: chemotaxis protein CheB [Rhizobacter sp.]|nr:chemotaxis protein CheB [Ferruginibacter sp.]
MKQPAFVIVVGASAGGVNALCELIGQVDPGINASLFIVMHLSRNTLSDFLVHRLQPLTSMPCVLAEDGGKIERGKVYIASANFHLLVKKEEILLGRGPDENGWRPCIDALFRSAAAAYNSRTIGIILTGMRDDGTAGMLAIKRSGGVCIVQDPEEAEHPDMALSVLNNMEVNYCLSLSQMGKVLENITQHIPEEIAVPADVAVEAEIAERVVVSYENVKQLGEKSIYACPDCGGGLWNISGKEGNKERVVRYRCHIGHSYSENDLVIKQGEIFEATLWTALRIMEERRNLFLKLDQDHRKRGLTTIARGYQDKASEIQVHVDKMKEVLFASQKIG